MASTPINPSLGAVAYGSYVADFASFDISAGQSVDNITPYGSNICSVQTGNGTPSFAFNVGAFAVAHGSSNNPNLAGGGTSNPTIFSAGGATATLKLEGTSVLYSFTGIMASVRIGHARMRGYVPLALSMANAGEVTETWAVT